MPKILAVAAVLLAGCGRAPDLIGIDNPAFPATRVADVTQHRIFVASTRESSQSTGVFYSGTRAPTLGLASVDVTVPPTHVVGKLERPRQLPPDPRTEFTAVNPVVFRNDAAFIERINQELATRRPGDRKLLVFVHGYNTTTTDALLLMTQFVQDSGYQGVPVLFTWASAAKIPRYVYDLNSALVARSKVKQLAETLARTNATGLDIFAHSMGTLLTMEGLVDAQLSGRLGRTNTIDHIVLASPDIDIDLFRTQIALLPASIVRKIYLLVSKDDSALRFSRKIAGGVPRVGASDIAEFQSLGVTVIDLSDIDDSSSGSHSKFAGSPEVVKLIGAGLNRVGRFDEGNSPGIAELLSGVPIRIIGF